MLAIKILNLGGQNMERVNLNEFAQKIAEREGKKSQVNIAQIKEILKIILSELAKLPLDMREEVILRNKEPEPPKDRLRKEGEQP